MHIAPERVSAFRLARHRLDRRAPGRDLVDIVRQTAGTQAQILNAAYISIWARVASLTPAAIDSALLHSRALVKTWAMRGTVHLLAAADLPIYAAGLRAIWRLHARSLERRGMDRRTVGRVVDVVKQACGRGLACFGPPRGQEVTFVRTDRWVPGLPPVSADGAEERLLRLYLRAYGPATLSDFAYWSGVQVRDARPILDRIRDEVMEVQVEGRPALLLREDERALHRATVHYSVRLLPNFDVYLLAHRDKSRLVDEGHYKQVYRKAGWVSQTVLADGRIVGTWTQRSKGGRLQIDVQPFARLRRRVAEGLEAEAEGLARFLALEAADVRIR